VPTSLNQRLEEMGPGTALFFGRLTRVVAMAENAALMTIEARSAEPPLRPGQPALASASYILGHPSCLRPVLAVVGRTE
jgi:hypothetical protein